MPKHTSGQRSVNFTVFDLRTGEQMWSGTAPADSLQNQIARVDWTKAVVIEGWFNPTVKLIDGLPTETAL